mgnify:FL=1
MTIVSTANLSTDTASIVAEIGGGSAPQVDIMIGVGLVKDSEAVFFQYLGDDSTQALFRTNGKPVTRIGPVMITGLSIAEDIYKDAGFDGSKLNVFVESQNGHNIMITSGLTTIWSQCVITGLMGLADADQLNSLICIDSWKGTAKMKPTFACIRNNGDKVTNNETYALLADARSNRDDAAKQKIMRDSIAIINESLTGVPVLVEDVTEAPKKDF